MDGNKSWRAGWWDFYPLLERPRRPLQWSYSSIIFTAHPVQPIITARHFSSSKQFVLPSPPPILASPTSYDPPTVISVSLGDEWLFAYFPRRDGEGIACLWKRGPHIDNWPIKESWSLPRSGGIVSASWIGNHREWAAGSTGLPERLPFRGPSVPISDATLLLITQDHYVHVTFVRQWTSALKTIKRSLMIPGQTWENTPPIDAGDINNTRQCFNATFGIGYNEKSLFIATHSRRLPPPVPTTMNTSAFNTMDLSVTGDLTFPDHRAVEWDSWGEERTVELYEVQIRFDGFQLGIALSQITTLDCLPLFLSGLTFVCTPPPSNPVPPVEAMMSPSQPKPNPVDKGRIGLVTSYINFNDYANPPTSTLVLYSITLRSVSNRPVWGVTKAATRTIEAGIVSYLEPFIDFSGPSTVQIYASVLDTLALSSAAKGKSHAIEIIVGHLKVLTLPNFTENTQWGSTPIKASQALGRDLPLFACLSPNRRLFFTLSSSLCQNQAAVYALPLPENPEVSGTRLPLALATAILGRLSTADLIHTLCSPHMAITDAAGVLCQTLDILHKFNDDSPNDYSWEILGLATEVYRAKALHAKNEEEADNLRNRWKTAQDICILAAYNLAFENCRESDNYDLEAVWQIIEMCLWVISFTETLMKVCVLSNSAAVADKEDAQLDSDALAPPILLTLCHPFSFHSLFVALKHVKDFRSFLGSLPAGSENSQVAQSLLVDAVDCSGIDLGSLISLLEEHYLASIQKTDPEECRKALAACHPTGMMQPHLCRLLQRISETQGILDKSILFIKATDLVDGVARLSIGNHPGTDERDIISNGALAKQRHRDVCLRCGGKTTINRDVAIPRGHLHSKWHLFELMWQLRCICGGAWSSLLR
ncbi:hypothetical protein CPB84DRAFT_1701767 [Gymnopilus junonius]|uniref:Mediator complex subunit 16 n=1 Tax=Gymnopilus junonius TaxID=109634 RepID=A0A9P5P0D2_GYMJU|nr:hypothetical protein CPB84DRAFT_1701767 [Gymnopilus junonius]